MSGLIPRGALGELAGMQGRIGAFWDDLFGIDLWGEPKVDGLFSPTLSVKSHEDRIEITTEVPGFAPEDIKVSINGDIITISGEQAESRQGGGENGPAEKRTRSFSKSFRAPCRIDRGRVKASHKDGALTITLPRLESEPPRRIEVSAE